MTSFNSEKFIKEQIDSIFSEISSPFELIICDDGSKDSTIKIINDYSKKHSEIKLIQNERNYGSIRNLEHVISFANGDIIVIADSDNVWLSGKINKTIKYFDNPKVSLVMHDAVIVDENLNTIMPSYYEWRKTKPGLFRNILRNGYGGSMMAFPSWMKRYILKSPKHIKVYFDEWIGMMCSKHGKVIFIQDKLSLWRRHSEAASSQGLNTQTPIKRKSGCKKIIKKIRNSFSFIGIRIWKIWTVIIH